MTTRNVGRTTGVLFLSAFLLYGGGSFLTTSTTGGALPLPGNATSPGRLSAGAVLLLLNSLAVVAIGALAFRVLRPRHHRTARTYLATRAAEAVLLALAPLGTLTLTLLARGGAETPAATGLQSVARSAVAHGETAYWLAMATLGVGSVLFCRALLKSVLLPRFLAAWGVLGYAVFAGGSIAELAGYEVGLVLSAPGGLFEVAAGSYLLVKGFRGEVPPSTAEAGAAPRSPAHHGVPGNG